MSWREFEPRASRLWIRHAPRRWPAANAPFLDLVERKVVWPVPARGRIELPAAPAVGGLSYLPPIELARIEEKRQLLAGSTAAGAAVLDQVIAAPGVGPAPAGGNLAVDLTEWTLGPAASLDRLLPRGSIAIVALLPAVCDSDPRWSTLLGSLAAQRPAAVIGIAPRLSPLDRRRIVERLGEDAFEAVHHAVADPAAGDLERGFARAVVAAGLNPFFERPALPLAPRATRNRRLSTALYECGERWLELGRAESEGTQLLAAARHAETSNQDLEALARERQLGLLPYLSPLARRTIESMVGDGACALLAELRAEWVGATVAA